MLGAGTSANAMPVPQANGGGSSIVLVDCAYGWYRGPDGHARAAVSTLLYGAEADRAFQRLSSRSALPR
jgi:hypothetical protein